MNRGIGGLGFLGQIAQGAEVADAFGEEYPVEMVNLVLQRPTQESSGFTQAAGFPGGILELDCDPSLAGDLAVPTGETQASFVAHDFFAAGFHDLRVEEHVFLGGGHFKLGAVGLFLVFRWNADHTELDRQTDLGRGQPDAVRRMHGLEHIGD